MSVNEDFARLEGSWRGINKLYLPWMPDPLKESDSTMSVSLKANGQFIQFDYTWLYEDEPQEGLMILGCDTKSNEAQILWTDSWHIRHTFMLADGKVAEDGTVSVKGHYKVPNGPDWGWRIDIISADDAFKLMMFNVSPDGAEEPAVEALYERGN